MLSPWEKPGSGRWGTGSKGKKNKMENMGESERLKREGRKGLKGLVRDRGRVDPGCSTLCLALSI